MINNSFQPNPNYLVPAQMPLPAIIGPELSKHNLFDDIFVVQNQGGFKKIKGIKMYFSEKRIMGISMTYELRTGKTLTTTHNPRKNSLLGALIGTFTGNKVQVKQLMIKEGDYIYQIQGSWDNKRLAYISFETYRGDKCYFGVPTFDLKTIKNPGFTFGPVRGSYRHKSMNYLVFPVTTIPQQFNIQPIGINPYIQNPQIQVPNNNNPNNKFIINNMNQKNNQNPYNNSGFNSQEQGINQNNQIMLGEPVMIDAQLSKNIAKQFNNNYPNVQNIPKTKETTNKTSNSNQLYPDF